MVKKSEKKATAKAAAPKPEASSRSVQSAKPPAPAAPVAAVPAPENVVVKNGYAFPAGRPPCPTCGGDTMQKSQKSDVLYFRCRRNDCERSKELISVLGRKLA
jgi:hypothetical protein